MTPLTDARSAAAFTFAEQMDDDGMLRPAKPMSPLADERESRLAQAIHRLAIQRWMTLEYLLDQRLKQPCAQLEPRMRAVLVTASAQLLFMDRVPPHAVVNESVALARSWIRPGAAGLVNAVLRRVAQMPLRREPETRWEPARDALPLEAGRIVLAEPLLPPLNQTIAHLSAATSHAPELISAWLSHESPERVHDRLQLSLRTPPVIVRLSKAGHLPNDPRLSEHDEPGYACWSGPYGGLRALLQEQPDQWVQDPTSAQAVNATRGLRVNKILDLCAGLGTKTRQLRAVFPEAKILASDTNLGRLCELKEVFAGDADVRVMEAKAARAIGPVADLIVLDVPCSNTGVLARRPEARYRFDRPSLQELVNKQRMIVREAAGLRHPKGHVLYSTCSLEPEENEQAAEFVAKTMGLRVIDQKKTEPSGEGSAYHDGGFYALCGPA